MYYQPTELNALLYYFPVIAYMEQLALLRTSKTFQLISMCTCLSQISFNTIGYLLVQVLHRPTVVFAMQISTFENMTHRVHIHMRVL